MKSRRPVNSTVGLLALSMNHLLAKQVIAGLVIVVSVTFLEAQSKNKLGNLVGTMAYVDQRELQTLGEAVLVTVELEHKREIIKLVSNDHGDYVVGLPKGKYCLKSAKASDGRLLTFSARQHRCFNINAAKDTRFDVMLLRP